MKKIDEYIDALIENISNSSMIRPICDSGEFSVENFEDALEEKPLNE